MIDTSRPVKHAGSRLTQSSLLVAVCPSRLLFLQLYCAARSQTSNACPRTTPTDPFGHCHNRNAQMQTCTLLRQQFDSASEVCHQNLFSGFYFLFFAGQPTPQQPVNDICTDSYTPVAECETLWFHLINISQPRYFHLRFCASVSDGISL